MSWIKRIFAFLGLILIAVILIVAFKPNWIMSGLTKLAINGANVQHRTIDINGYEINYFDNERADAAVLVLLHGFSDTKESWFPVCNELAKSYRIIAPDMIGHGENKKDASQNHSLQNQADNINEFLAALNIEKAHFIGVSMGGGVSANFAIQHPERTQSISLISPAGINGHANVSKTNTYMQQFATLEEKRANLPMLPTQLDKESLNEFKEYIFYDGSSLPNHIFKEFIRHSVENRIFYLEVLDDFVVPETGEFINGLDGKLNQINCPVLIVWGKQDPLIDVSSAQVFMDSLPQTPELHILDQCGHAPTFEKDKETEAILTAFLAKHAS